MSVPPLKLDANGLVTVVAQDYRSGEIRMIAHATTEAVERTLETGEAHFFSRSRGRLWRKGEESGNVLHVLEVWVDCDADALVYLVEPRGPSCHTGRPTCFFRRLDAGGAEHERGRAQPVLARLEVELEARRASSAERSYTRSLLDGGAPKIGAKLREEADELARALEGESDDRVAAEAADVVYHLLVGLMHRGLHLADVEAELARRFGVSGHDEKKGRR
ncbi:MAG: bifunctional phosphoribosyl-AMP cyclohydrolase/phosphoribosyl-ATP diphosphatase HisIE [Sandaracinaceae bacterium]|nr:bifunctional phosphoribosyl-AMP cyclohydrolase/phosphoribosyl-ATP diphosphatase HisIE [Sandaracinaceae bacterium]